MEPLGKQRGSRTFRPPYSGVWILSESGTLSMYTIPAFIANPTGCLTLPYMEELIHACLTSHMGIVDAALKLREFQHFDPEAQSQRVDLHIQLLFGPFRPLVASSLSLSLSLSIHIYIHIYTDFRKVL